MVCCFLGYITSLIFLGYFIIITSLVVWQVLKPHDSSSNSLSTKETNMGLKVDMHESPKELARGINYFNWPSPILKQLQDNFSLI